jgi:hypothetical protein
LLVGERIGPGWRKTVLAKMGGVRGCTHLTDLLLGPVTTTVMQTIASARTERESRNSTGKPALLDSCHAFASDGPVVQRQWPDLYTGDKVKAGDRENG